MRIRMRLLSHSTEDNFKLTTFNDENHPPYAILSHTWADGQEVTYDELIAGTGKEKAGYDKLRFCGERAATDDLQYFWVDTCCINKATSDELGAAINSMFRWYQRAAKCYVFLSDVAVPHDVTDPQLYQITWRNAFRRSRWFTRGWTLQELLAPASVEFFSKERERLGCKVSLEQEVHEITGILTSVLRGQRLHDISVDERMSWAAKRITTIPEDKAYCLFGIFGVFMPLIYGEGEEHASIRLREEIQKRLGPLSTRQMEGAQDLKAQNDLLKTLPIAMNAPYNTFERQHDPICLPDTRVDLLRDIYSWADGGDSPCIFWLSGLAGTGKSTVARTVAAEHARQGRLLGSFFFSRGGGDISHAGKFATSLAVQLADNIPSLKQTVCEAISERSDLASQSLRDQWRHLVLGPLSKLTESAYPSSYSLVIDALDECEGEKDIWTILQLLVDAQSLKPGQLRVFLTSRPEMPIRHGFVHVPSASHQDFMLHNISPVIIDHDIYIFLERNFYTLGKELHFNDSWPGAEIINRLVCNACGLFIWAATAYRFVREGRRFAVKRLDILLQPRDIALNAPEKQLDEIYINVLRNCISPDYSDTEADELRFMLTSLLGSIITLLSPLPTTSLSKLLSIPQIEIDQTLNELHAILNIPDKPSRPLRLHHPSFRDFLLDSTRCRDTSFWVEEKQAHQTLAVKCIQLMSQHLKQDICSIKRPGALMVDIDRTVIAQYLPLELQYACLHWVQHLERGGTSLCDNGEVYIFLQEHLLHWLEALGWMGKVPEGVYAISSLNLFVDSTECPNLSKFLHDAKRLVLYSRSAIEQAPLQTYSSTLVFAPAINIVRQKFKSCIPEWIRVLPIVENSWSAELQTIEGHSDRVLSVAFSLDGRTIASGSSDQTVKLWDSVSGAEQRTLEGHSGCVKAVAFSPDGKTVSSASNDSIVKLWDIASGAEQRTLKGHLSCVNAVAFSPDGKTIASASHDCTVKLWNAVSGAEKRTLRGHLNCVKAVAFSPNGKTVASASHDNTVKLWDVVSGAEQYTLRGHLGWVEAVAFSPDSKTVSSASRDHTVKLWNTASGTEQRTLKGHSECVNAVAFSPNSRTIASASDDTTVKLWDTASGAEQRTLKGHLGCVNAVAFSPNSKTVALASNDSVVKLWDTALGAKQRTLEGEGHSRGVNAIAISPDGKIVASASHDGKVMLWDAASGAKQCTLEGYRGWVHVVTFSLDSKTLASVLHDGKVKLWDAASGAEQCTLEGEGWSGWVNAIAISPDGKTVASASYDGKVKLWDAASGAEQRTLEGHSDLVNAVPFSPEGRYLETNWSILYLNDIRANRDMNHVKSPSRIIVERNWLVLEGRNILWLPPDVRPGCSTVYERFIAIGCPSGRVVCMEFGPLTGRNV